MLDLVFETMTATCCELNFLLSDLLVSQRTFEDVENTRKDLEEAMKTFGLAVLWIAAALRVEFVAALGSLQKYQASIALGIDVLAPRETTR